MRQKILTGVDRSVLVLFSLLFGITVISAGLSVNFEINGCHALVSGCIADRGRVIRADAN